MKYKTIGAFKNVQNVGYCKAEADMKVGMGVILDQANKIAKTPASADEAKTCYRIVSSINDKPELHNFSETVLVLKGEYVRADDLHTVEDMEIELAQAEIKDELTDLAVGDKLVFGANGIIEKATAVDGYAVYFEVIAKTGYMGAGVLAIIRVQ